MDGVLRECNGRKPIKPSRRLLHFAVVVCCQQVEPQTVQRTMLFRPSHSVYNNYKNKNSNNNRSIVLFSISPYSRNFRGGENVFMQFGSANTLQLQCEPKNTPSKTFCNTFAQAMYISVKFWQFVANLLPRIFTSFVPFMLI